MNTTVKQIGVGFVIGSIATFVIAFVFWQSGHPLLAGETILVSPVPCPPGLPC